MFVQLGLVLLLSRGLLGESDAFVGDTRIIGGFNAPKNLANYQVSIRKKYLNQELHWCGGSIIHEEWVLTAAQCTYGMNANRLPIVAGTTDPKSGGDRYKIKKIIIHEKFSIRKLINNVALMKVDGKIKMNKNVRVIGLRKEPVAVGSNSILTGWGITDNKGTMANKLQMLILTIISNKDCKEQLKRAFLAPVDDKQLCATEQRKGGGCLGDSGSPLVVTDIKKGFVQAGVRSLGTFPCAQGNPEVFSSVSSYYDWIMKNMKN
ncbi:chymotrypsin-2-like [Pieris rapae]|uniref:chymotrypsin-2-like n=1 Tax=Pieris rapae TaxID=64459 RepID=UPI001E27E48F|nr:chymotrypsin-2-like [Pieris rapae]